MFFFLFSISIFLCLFKNSDIQFSDDPLVGETVG